ncbi:MAG TPA: DUF4186 domain-containing protein [Chthoniobacterales bacterium]|jgi:hypothetical protein|nr:DUF4186 domain-containing protein [Chthoniobacterales bacterium]
MRDPAELFLDLAKSKFRSRRHLNAEEREYLARRGLDTVLKHAAEFIETRLAPRLPANDGRQTPWRNHPVFVAQHATATCCRGCLAKWHRIPRGREMTAEEQGYAVDIIGRWLTTEMDRPVPRRRLQSETPDLFD